MGTHEQNDEAKRVEVFRRLFQWSDDEWRRFEESKGNAGLEDRDDDEPMSEEEIAEVEAPIFVALGIDGDWTPDGLAPPIDEQRLKAFIRSELSREQEEEIIHLMARYRCWYHAWQRFVRT